MLRSTAVSAVPARGENTTVLSGQTHRKRRCQSLTGWSQQPESIQFRRPPRPHGRVGNGRARLWPQSQRRRLPRRRRLALLALLALVRLLQPHPHEHRVDVAERLRAQRWWANGGGVKVVGYTTLGRGRLEHPDAVEAPRGAGLSRLRATRPLRPPPSPLPEAAQLPSSGTQPAGQGWLIPLGWPCGAACTSSSRSSPSSSR